MSKQIRLRYDAQTVVRGECDTDNIGLNAICPESWELNTELRQPVTDRSAWNGAQLDADPRWRHVLSAVQRAELVGAARAMARTESSSSTPDTDFIAIPTLKAHLETLAEEVAEGRGVALVRGIPLDEMTEPEMRAAYWCIALAFGTPISQNSKGELMADVTDHGNDIAKDNTRGYSTRAELGFHSDMCEMTTLLCVNPAKRGGESKVASSMSVYNHILAHHREHLDVLHRGFHHHLRGEGPQADLDEITDHRVPVFSYHHARLSCGFNPKISRNGEFKRRGSFSDEETQALACVSTTAAMPDLVHSMWLERGDVQIVNNHTVLHSRTEYVDFEDVERKRRLWRLWLNPHRQRALTDDFADRYNTGPRGGVAVGTGADYRF